MRFTCFLRRQSASFDEAAYLSEAKMLNLDRNLVSRNVNQVRHSSIGNHELNIYHLSSLHVFTSQRLINSYSCHDLQRASCGVTVTMQANYI
ncbi:hypothetical protein KCU62_g54, partial [Aureobasidium sp. EXF-3399]